MSNEQGDPAKVAQGHATNFFPCSSCGAKLEFVPGIHQLVCANCGSRTEIAVDDTKSTDSLAELDYSAYLAKRAGDEPQIELQTVKCPGCGAQSQLAQNVVADRCPFCAIALIASPEQSHRIIKPACIAPFVIDEAHARSEFDKWTNGLWFAPNELKKAAKSKVGLKGIYIPYWTYDADTRSDYEGQRGTDYYVTQTRYVDGEAIDEQVIRTQWHSVSGTVEKFFDDTMVIGSNSLPLKYAENLTPWELDKLVAYQDSYVSGFILEAYQIGLEPGFKIAQQKMATEIRYLVAADIGGDHQQISDVDSTYGNITFKHILLPIWLASYSSGGKPYSFVINGQTGEVQGERPYSVAKIASLVVLIILIIALIVITQR